MRALLLALVSLALLTAGCFGGDDEGGETTTTPTPTTSTPTTTTPTTPTNETPTPTTPTTPPAPMPKEACAPSGTFNAPPPPVGTPQTATCTIEEGYTQVTMNVTWGGSPQLGNAVAVNLIDPDGTTVLSCSFTSPTPPATEAEPCSAGPESITTAGEWTVQFAGEGTVTASASIMVS